MADDTKQDWRTPTAMAIPKGGYLGKPEQGRYGPIFPKTPACYGFSIIAKLIPGGEEACYEHAKKIEQTVAKDPHCLAVLKLHYLRWQIFQINGESYFQYQGIFDTDFDKYTEDAVSSLLGHRHRYRLREPRGLPQGLEDQARGIHQVCPRPPPAELSRIR